MKRTVLAFFAAGSLLWSALSHAATRPGYGGTLRVNMRLSSTSLDPADVVQSGSFAGNNISSLIFDTLVTLDRRGVAHPALAISWQSETGGQRWQFKLRTGVKFNDGTSLTAEQVAASLRAANPSWKIVASGDGITIERDVPDAAMPAELAMERNAIARRGGSAIQGTGPFAIQQWDAGKKLILSANNDYWDGRPYVDSVEILMGQGLREQMLALDLGKADVIEVAPEQARRAATEGRHVESSDPSEFMALVFAGNVSDEATAGLREALNASINRSALANVLLQGGGDPSAALLPNWLSGYGFLFSPPSDAGSHPAQTSRQAVNWSLAYDANDPLARVVAERIVLNARDAGISLQPGTTNKPDLRLVRTPLASLDVRLALMTLADSLRLPKPNLASESPEALYAGESGLLHSRIVIPLLHLRASYGLSAKVRGWRNTPDGRWYLNGVSLDARK